MTAGELFDSVPLGGTVRTMDGRKFIKVSALSHWGDRTPQLLSVDDHHLYPPGDLFWMEVISTHPLYGLEVPPPANTIAAIAPLKRLITCYGEYCALHSHYDGDPEQANITMKRDQFWQQIQNALKALFSNV